MAVYENGNMRAESPDKGAIAPEKSLQYQQAQQQRETKEYLSYKESITHARKVMASMEENWKIPVIGRIIQFFQKGKHEELGALADAGNQRLKDLSASIAAREERMEALKKEIPQRETDPVKDLKSMAKTDPERFQKEVLTLLKAKALRIPLRLAPPFCFSPPDGGHPQRAGSLVSSSVATTRDIAAQPGMSVSWFVRQTGYLSNFPKETRGGSCLDPMWIPDGAEESVDEFLYANVYGLPNVVFTGSIYRKLRLKSEALFH